MTRYLILTVTCPAIAAEAAAELLQRARTGGVVVEENPPDTVVLHAYLPVTPNADVTLDALRQRLAALPSFGLGETAPTLEIADAADEDWAEAWKEHFKAFPLGRRFSVVPSWEEPTGDEARIVLRLDPGMAFGSGLHASTQLAVEILEDVMAAPRGAPAVVVDVGTGSGVLAIVAGALGARSVVAIDNDPVALEVARRNAALNGAREQIVVVEGHFLAGAGSEGADVIVANLTAELLREMAGQVPERLTDDGHLIASGIVADKVETVREAFERVGLRVVEERAREEWRALLAQKI